MSKGRRVPPPFTQVGHANPTPAETAQALRGQAGLFMMRYEHDDGCLTLRSQNLKDCRCAQVDHRLLRYVDRGKP